MFEGNQYLLTIPLPSDVSDRMNELIFAIAEKYGEDPTKITSKMQIRSEFHITLGVFHPNAFQTQKSLFRQILHYLHEHKDQYNSLKKMFSGNCVISGIGFHGGNKKNLLDSDVIWAATMSNEVSFIRDKIHNLLQFAGVDNKHFQFTDPHITLMTKKGDIHGIPKPAMINLNEFLEKDHIKFPFDTVNFEKDMGKILLSFGSKKHDGKPSKKYKNYAKEVKKSFNKDPAYNWGNLFTNEAYKKDARQIKESVMAHGIGWLFKNYPKEKAMEIKKLITK